MSTEAQNLFESQHDAKLPVSRRAFTYDWWMQMAKKAYWEFENLAWHSYMYDVADYCRSRAIKSLERHGG